MDLLFVSQIAGCRHVILPNFFAEQGQGQKSSESWSDWANDKLSSFFWRCYRAYWRSLVSKYRNSLPLFKSTQFNKQYHHAVPLHGGTPEKSKSFRLMKPDFFPVYALFGLVLLQLFMGFINLKQVLMHCPSVFVDKKKRKTIPEVVQPDTVAKIYIN